MAKKKEDTKKKGAKEKDPEKEAKRKARMEAIKNRPAGQRPNGKQIDVIKISDNSEVQNFGYAIKTKKGEEISLNWEESEYSWNDDQSGSGRSLKKQMPKDIHAELRNVYFDAEEEGHTISDSVKRESLKGAEIEEIQIFIENFSGRKEDVGFWLQQMVFHFSDTDEYYHLPITHDYKLILE